MSPVSPEHEHDERHGQDGHDEPVRTARFARARLREAPPRTAEPHWLDTREEEREIERLAPDEPDAWQGPDTVPVPPPPPASQPAPTDRF